METRFFTPGTIATLSMPGQPSPAEASPGPRGSAHDPPLCPRDEAVFLLTAAAEVEHALMVQYLYAAYSVRVVDDDPDHDALQELRQLLLQVAREEMGHLATVQNLLHLLGGPLNLHRGHSPSTSGIYPFRFALEPVTLGSLAKYVAAESPGDAPPPDMPPEDVALLAEIRRRAVEANGGQPIQHVGPLFERLAQLLSGGADGVTDTDLQLDSHARQARAEDWGFTPRSVAGDQSLIVESFPGTDVAAVRAAAVAAVRSVGAQGEGYDLPAGDTEPESHFERFLDMYRRVDALEAAGVAVTWPVVTDPNTSPDQPAGAARDDQSAGRINDPATRAWAQLFNLRYRLLLGLFSHFLRLDDPLYQDGPGAHRGDRTRRGLLLLWTFDEMRRLGKIAEKLVRSPKDPAAGSPHAGPPFELPYTLGLPDGEPQRWRTHADVLGASSRLIRERLQPEGSAERDCFLDSLLQCDAQVERGMRALADGQEVPSDLLPSGFAKAVHILEEAVRGFSIGAHTNFWADRTRDQFLASNMRPINRRPDGTVDPVPGNSKLIQRLTRTDDGRMPQFRPAVPVERIDFLRQWIADGCPDDDPPDRIGIAHECDPGQQAR